MPAFAVTRASNSFIPRMVSILRVCLVGCVLGGARVPNLCVCVCFFGHTRVDTGVPNLFVLVILGWVPGCPPE